MTLARSASVIAGEATHGCRQGRAGRRDCSWRGRFGQSRSGRSSASVTPRHHRDDQAFHAPECRFPRKPAPGGTERMRIWQAVAQAGRCRSWTLTSGNCSKPVFAAASGWRSTDRRPAAPSDPAPAWAMARPSMPEPPMMPIFLRVRHVCSFHRPLPGRRIGILSKTPLIGNMSDAVSMGMQLDKLCALVECRRPFPGEAPYFNGLRRACRFDAEEPRGYRQELPGSVAL